MILRKQPGFLQLLYVMRGSVLIEILPQIALTMVFAAFVMVLHQFFPALGLDLPGLPLSLLGIALSIFLGFRNNACYDRWWEARKQWGTMIAVTRTFARQSQVIDTSTPEGREARRTLLENMIICTHALARHLRPDHETIPSRADLDPDAHPEFQGSRNRPDLILRVNANLMAGMLRKGQLSDILYQMLDRTLAEFGAAQAACERINSAPLPFPYSLLVNRTAYLFCFLFPFGFTDVLGWFTPFAAGIMAYTFFGLDILGDDLEKPFGTTVHALPLTAMTRTIEIGFLEALGESEVPEGLQPVDYVLL